MDVNMHFIKVCLDACFLRVHLKMFHTILRFPQFKATLFKGLLNQKGKGQAFVPERGPAGR